MNSLISRLSLRQMLTLPYVLLVVLAAAIIGVLSYRAGSDAVDTLSDYVLNETVARISQAIERHVSGSEAVLETAFPADVPASASLGAELDALRTRFWLATTIHRDPNNYAYYGNRKGHFFGLWRYSETEAELRLRLDDAKPRSIYRYSSMRGALKDPVLEERMFDPRERPWYKAGQGASNQTWTAIYIDFKTLQLVSTRARRVNNAAGDFEGVVATDVSLEHLNSFLKRLKLSANGYALIFEPDGNIIATSRGPHLQKGAGDQNTRLNATASTDPMVVATYKSVAALTGMGDKPGSPHAGTFAGPDGQTVQVGYERLRDKAGLDWIVAVAVPRDDFLQKVTENVKRTVIAALMTCLLIAVIGFAILNIITRDLRQLAVAAKEMGDGIVDPRIPVERGDEIGDLAKSFAALQQRLLTDRLTGIANREAIVRRVEDRIIRQRRRGDSHPFGVFFVDLNRFKQINDNFGHETGDKVLIEIGQRLSKRLRENDLAARYGGDEFVVMLDNVDNRATANRVRDSFEAALGEPLQSLLDVGPHAAALGAGAAIGIALCPEDGQDLETLLECADADMYVRKQARVAGAADPDNVG